MITTGEALGHGFEVDETTIEQVAASLDGVPGRWTHGGLSDDGLARHLGHWRGGAVEQFKLCRGCALESKSVRCAKCGDRAENASRVIADFEFSKSGHAIRPDGLDVPAAVYLMDRAEGEPGSLGISIVAEFELEEQTLEDGITRTIGHLAPVKRALRRADWVADPAANPVGLHAGTGALPALAEEATAQLNRIVTRVGREEALEKAQAFLARYFARIEKEQKPMEPVAETKPVESLEAMPEDAKKAEPKKDEPAKPEGVCPECGAELAKIKAEAAGLRAEVDAIKLLASGASAALEASKAKVAELEAARAKDAADRAVERVDSIREAGAKVGELMTQEDRAEIIGALGSASVSERKLGESLLSKFRAQVERAQGIQGARKQAHTDKVDLAAEDVRAQMLERAGVAFSRDGEGRVQVSTHTKKVGH